MKLKDAQVTFIERDLRERGISYDHLHEDLTDHICSEIEGQLEKGVPFMDAYLAIVARFESRGFKELNRETTSTLNSLTLVTNFLRSSLRLFKSNISYGIIRIVGLAIGVATFLLALLYSNYEKSFDAFHDDVDSIYRLGRQSDDKQIGVTSFPLVPTLREDYVDYEFTRFFKDRSNTLFKLGDKTFYESKMIWADAWFLSFFKFDGFKGDVETALKEPYSIVLTEQMAQKYFGHTPELGEFIEFSWNDKVYPLKITGLITKWPNNMHIQFEALVSFQTGETLFPGDINNGWEMNYCYSYVKLPAGSDPQDFERTFESFVSKHVNLSQKAYTSFLGFLQPLRDIHLQPDVVSNYTLTVDPNYPKISLVIGVLVLLITSINFIMLTVVQFHKRSKEMGVRKAVGANRSQIIFQLVFETCVLVALSFLLGIGLIYPLIGFVNQFMLTELTFSMLYMRELAIITPAMILVLTLLTALYPAILFSERNIMDTITLGKKKAKISLRKLLLTTQFWIAAVLISFSYVIYSQLTFIQNKETGYAKDQVIYIPHGRSIRYEPEVFRSLALENPNVEKVALSFYKPTDNIGNTISVFNSNDQQLDIAATSVDEYFFETFNIDFVSGSNFSKEAMDMEKVFILNESAVKLLELENPIGKVIKTQFRTGDPNMPIEAREGQIIGVVKDVHFESLHNAIKPLVFLVKPYWYFYINVKVQPQNIQGSLQHLEEVWGNLFPNEPFEYAFLDDEFFRQYQAENRMAQGLIAMSILAVLMACFGLFGYVKFVAQQIVKQVSIRKVLGANMGHLAKLFSKEFIISILIANVISWPITYFLSKEWLHSFSYRIDLTLFPFYISLIILLILGLLTVSGELVKTVRLNPCNTLKYE